MATLPDCPEIFPLDANPLMARFSLSGGLATVGVFDGVNALTCVFAGEAASCCCPRWWYSNGTEVDRCCWSWSNRAGEWSRG